MVKIKYIQKSFYWLFDLEKDMLLLYLIRKLENKLLKAELI